ncbi:hypothetical protein J7894_01095 [Mycoplasmopsis agalactiae]|nr:hypothetical protein [Mycoplasmopsis agalactiae]MCE6090686.1 hypothetical protein [Mycoplasmopsis agalactiae]
MKTSPRWFKTLIKSITANDQLLGEMLAEANKENNSVSFSYKVAPKEINIDFKGLSQPEVLPLFLKEYPEYINKTEQAQKIIASSSHFARFYSSTRIINIWNYDLGCYFEVIDNYGKNKPLITLCFKDNINNGTLPKLLKVERLKAGSLVAITDKNEIICFNDLLTLRENNSPGVNITFKAQIPKHFPVGINIYALRENQFNNDLVDIAIWNSARGALWYGQIDTSTKNSTGEWNYSQAVSLNYQDPNSSAFEVTNVKNILLTTSEKVINNKREFFGNMLVNVAPDSVSRDYLVQNISIDKEFGRRRYSDFAYLRPGSLSHNEILDRKILSDRDPRTWKFERGFWALGVERKWTKIYEVDVNYVYEKISPILSNSFGGEWSSPNNIIFINDFYIVANDGYGGRKITEKIENYIDENKHTGKDRETLETEFLNNNHIIHPTKYSHEGDNYLYDPQYLRDKLSFNIIDGTHYLNKLLKHKHQTIKCEARAKDTNTIEFRLTIAEQVVTKTVEIELPVKELGIGIHPDKNFIARGYLRLELNYKVRAGNAGKSELIHLNFITNKTNENDKLLFVKNTGIKNVNNTSQGIVINNNDILIPVLTNSNLSTNNWEIYKFDNSLSFSKSLEIEPIKPKLYARLPQALVKNPKLYAITENANDKPWVFVVDDNFIGSYVGQNNSEVLPNTNAQFELFQIYDNDSNAYKLDLSNLSELMIFREQNNARILGNFTDEKSNKSFKKWINLRYDGKPYHKDNFPYVYAWNYKRDILQNNFKAAYCADEDGEFYLPIKDTIVKNNEVKFISILKNTTLNTPTGKLNAHKVQIIDNNNQVIDERKQNFHHKTPFDNYQITFAKTFNVFMFENKTVNERYANLIASLWKDIGNFDKLRLTHFRVKVKLPKYETVQGNKRFVGTYETTKEFEINPDNVLVEGNSAFMYFPFVMETDPNADTVISNLEIGNRNTGEYNKVATFDKVVILKDKNVTHKYTYEIVKMKFLEYLD